MLQSVPDPFDSYGQPHAEDQIFSILPPLSILAPSSSPSPLMVSPQTVTSDVFATGTSARWAHSNGTLYSDAAASDWADVLPSSASGALLVTPTKAQSSGSPSRRPNRTSSPPGSSSRRAESKLRSVLSVIDEAQPRQNNDDTVPSAATDTPEDAAAMNGGSPVAARDSDANWPGFPFGEFPRSTSQDTTPRNSISGPASPTIDTHPSLNTPGTRTPESDRTSLPIAT